jgi:hypothetical protein
MKTFKVEDRVRAVKDVSGWFTIGQIGTVEGANEHHIFVTFDNGREAPVKADEIELIESEPTTQNPFPTLEEFKKFYYGNNIDAKNLYNYFAQFGVREVFPEVGKEYEGRTRYLDSPVKGKLQYYCIDGRHCESIRPIQPSRLEQLKAKHPNLTQDEQTELIDLLTKETK